MLNLKTVILLTAVLAVTSLSCSKNKDGDKLPDSIQAIINQDKNCTCLVAVNKYKWKSDIIYHTPYKGICCTTPWVTFLYNEKGEHIQLPGITSLQQFLDESELIANVYTCEAAKNNP
jgi:hypothetical protein